MGVGEKIIGFFRGPELTPEERARRYEEAKQQLPFVLSNLDENTLNSPARELRDRSRDLTQIEGQIKQLEHLKGQPGISGKLNSLKNQKNKLDSVVRQLKKQVEDLNKKRKEYQTILNVYGKPDTDDFQQAA